MNHVIIRKIGTQKRTHRYNISLNVDATKIEGDLYKSQGVYVG